MGSSDFLFVGALSPLCLSMTRRLTLAAVLAAVAFANVVEPQTGISFEDAMKDDQRLMGVGVREKAVFGLIPVSVYAVGLYGRVADSADMLKFAGRSLEQMDQTYFNEVEESPGAKTIVLKMYRDVGQSTMQAALVEAVAPQLKDETADEREKLLQHVKDIFNHDVKEKDVVRISVEWNERVTFSMNDETPTTVDSAALSKALLRVYLSDQGLSPSLKSSIAQRWLSSHVTGDGNALQP